MINQIIAYSIRNKLIIGLLVLALIVAGIYSMTTVKLGSVPDITNNQVQVMTVSPTLATEDIEQFVTYPVERAMGNLPGVREIRSISRFGLSVVTIIFEDDLGIYLPRQMVQEKLSEVKKNIPEKFGSPFMGPITTGLGEIYQYTIEPKPGYDTVYSLTELRTIQDWIISRQMTLVDGVVGVNAFGGKIKQYEIAINPERLNAMDVSISEVFNALKRNNVNTGGAYIEKNHMSNFIRGEGLVRSLDDIRDIVVKNRNGIPITIQDVATKVHYGHQVRYGAFTKDGHEAVGGMVLMLRGSNPNAVIRNVKNRMEQVNKVLPEGLEIKPFLDRSELIGRTTSTVTTNLSEGALIVIFVLVLLLGSLRGGLITASVIPLSLLFAFILMNLFDVWANLMSLGAIDFGIIVDGAVIIVEGTVHEIEKRIKKGGSPIDPVKMDEIAYDASSTMMNSAFFGQLIILIVFAPILFLTGIEGKMFQPMAYTFGFAVLGAIVLCLTYVPMMSALFMRPSEDKNNIFAKIEGFLERISNLLIEFIYKAYRPLLGGALKFRMLVIGIALALLASAIYTFSRMGAEFVPQLDEGDIAMQALVRPGSSLNESIEVSEKIERILLEEFPEVKTVLGRIGVADIPTDPMPMDISDLFIILEKDKDKWVSAQSKAGLIEKIKEELSVLTGVKLVFSQPVELRFNELLTGVREDVAVKLYGEELDVLADKAEEMAEIIRGVKGAADVNPERISGLPQMTVRYNRDKIAQYGVHIEKLNEYISTAFAGGVAGVVFEGEKRFDMVVRFDEAHRKSIEDIRSLYIDLPDGTQIPLEEVADINYRPGPMQISRDNTFRRTYVGVNVRGRDVESVVHDIQAALDDQLELPPGYSISYGGEFENLQRAKKRLSIVVPIALFLIFILLYFALHSLSQSLMIYMAIPLAAIGGVFSLWIRGMPFSISAGVGFIVLFGVAVLNGLVLISRFNSLKSEGMTDLINRIHMGTKERLRPILLTATAAIMGFTPMALSQSAGAEVQRPLATVVIGGLISATLLTLVVVPVLYYLQQSFVKKDSGGTSPPITASMLIPALFFLSLFFPNKELIAQAPDSVEWDNLPVLNMDEAVSKAQERYPEIKAGMLKIKQQEALKKTAWDLGHTVLFTGKEETGSDREGIYTKIGIRQQGIDVFGINSELKVREERIALARSALELTEAELRREVLLNWASTYSTKNKYRVFRTLDSIFTGIAKAAELKLETEDISRLEYLSTVNQANEVSIRRKQAYRDYVAALRQLNLWFASDTLYSVPKIPRSALDDFDKQLMDSISHHPKLEYFRRKLRLTEANIEEKKSDFYPTLQGTYASQNIQGESGFHTYEIGLEIPLLFTPEKGRLQAARLEHKIANQRLRQTGLELNARYQNALQEYMKWLDSWHYYRDQALPLAMEQRNGALTAYREGAVDYVAFLQNIRDTIGIQVESWNVFEALLESRYRLEYFLNSDR